MTHMYNYGMLLHAYIDMQNAIQNNNINMVHNSAYIASGEIPQNCAASLTAYYGSSGVKRLHACTCNTDHAQSYMYQYLN